jgi:calcineurin-like phosphoesterase family protein
MTKKVWLAGDHHLGNKEILTYLNDNGNKLRPFKNLNEMHYELINKHNNVIKPENTFYSLKDIVIDKSAFPLLPKFNGNKRIILGNHDANHSYKNLTNDFLKIYGVKYLSDYKVILSHMPVHPSCIKYEWINIHSHSHCKNISDTRYINVSVEQINDTPINLNKLIKKQQSVHITRPQTLN